MRLLFDESGNVEWLNNIYYIEENEEIYYKQCDDSKIHLVKLYNWDKTLCIDWLENSSPYTQNQAEKENNDMTRKEQVEFLIKNSGIKNIHHYKNYLENDIAGDFLYCLVERYKDLPKNESNKEYSILNCPILIDASNCKVICDDCEDLKEYIKEKENIKNHIVTCLHCGCTIDVSLLVKRGIENHSVDSVEFERIFHLNELEHKDNIINRLIRNQNKIIEVLKKNKLV